MKREREERDQNHSSGSAFSETPSPVVDSLAQSPQSGDGTFKIKHSSAFTDALLFSQPMLPPHVAGREPGLYAILLVAPRFASQHPKLWAVFERAYFRTDGPVPPSRKLREAEDALRTLIASCESEFPGWLRRRLRVDFKNPFAPPPPRKRDRSSSKRKMAKLVS